MLKKIYTRNFPKIDLNVRALDLLPSFQTLENIITN